MSSKLGTKVSKLYTSLFRLISVDEKNEPKICSIIDDAAQIQTREQISEVINKPHACYTGAETMLMWAVWRLKKDVVRKLLEYGADPKFENETGNGASTYWDEDTICKDEDSAVEIAKMLHAAGTDLLRSYSASWCIVRKARECGFSKLQTAIEELDPEYKAYKFEDDVPCSLRSWKVKLSK